MLVIVLREDWRAGYMMLDLELRLASAEPRSRLLECSCFRNGRVSGLRGLTVYALGRLTSKNVSLRGLLQQSEVSRREYIACNSMKKISTL